MIHVLFSLKDSHESVWHNNCLFLQLLCQRKTKQDDAIDIPKKKKNEPLYFAELE